MGLSSFKHWFPFLSWSRPTRASFQADVAAGLAVALLAIPQSLAYAQLAGVPAQHGLYAAFLPAIIGALFGSSALLSTGPVALTSMLTASSVALLAVPGTQQFVAFVLLVALLSGLFQIGLGLARAGILLNLLSHPVLVGFINAAAIVIALAQLPALTGIAVPAGNSTLGGSFHVLSTLQDTHVLTLAMGALAFLFIDAIRRWAPRLPGVLFMVIGVTVLSYLVGYERQGGAVVGDIPRGMPQLSVPAMNWQAVIVLIPAAFVVALVSFMEAMSSCKVIADKTRKPWDENQELIGQGLAKVAAAFCNAMPVSGSFSRSALNLASGARSPYASLITAGLVLLAILLLTNLLHHLPKPALAAMIVLAVAKLVNWPAMKLAFRAGRDDGLAALLTFSATLAFAPNIQNGIIAGIIFSLGAFIYRRMLPRMAVQALREDGAGPNADASGGSPKGERIVGLRFDAALFFVNASFFEAAVLKLERDNPELEAIVVFAHGINILDATGVEVLRDLTRHLRERGITLVISHAKHQFIEVAKRTGLLDELGPANVFDSHDNALAAVFARSASRRAAAEAAAAEAADQAKPADPVDPPRPAASTGTPGKPASPQAPDAP